MGGVERGVRDANGQHQPQAHMLGGVVWRQHLRGTVVANHHDFLGSHMLP